MSSDKAAKETRPIKVSVVIPARNEEKYISRCLDSILANDYGSDSFEIIVVDGMSRDRTREIVVGYARRHPFIRLLENPRRIIPAALNIGIREAQGEIIVRMDAHTAYAADYISCAVEALETSGAAMVGAVQRPTGDTPVTRAIAAATCSPFGVGNSYQHYSTVSRWVEDSVYLGCWYKKTLTQLGGFNEGWEVNEDSELIHRLCQAGGKVLLCANLRSTYHVRKSLRDLARQYFRYGMWRARTSLNHPSSFRWRQLAPPAFVLGLLLSPVLARISRTTALAVPAAYALANLFAMGTILARQGWGFFLIPAAFSTIHLSWGTGFLFGLVRFSGGRWAGAAKRPLPTSDTNSRVA